jgi:transposase
MRTPRDPRQLGLDHHDRRRLAAALRRAADVRTYRRVQAVLLVALGLPIPAVAGGTAASPGAVYAWVRRYLRTRRPDDLSDAPREGRPPTAETITGPRITREFRRDPLRLGYAATGWTAALLAAHLGRRYGCPITARTLRRRMRELGLRWKRPRYVYTGRDPHRGQKKGASSGGSS